MDNFYTLRMNELSFASLVYENSIGLIKNIHTVKLKIKECFNDGNLCFSTLQMPSNTQHSAVSLNHLDVFLKFYIFLGTHLN